MSEISEIVVCRTCVTECENFKSLHRKGYFLGELTTLAELLTYFSDIEISPDDQFPYICLRCVQHLTSSFVFKRMVIEADEELRSQINVPAQMIQDQKVELCSETDPLVNLKSESFEKEYVTEEKVLSRNGFQQANDSNTERNEVNDFSPTEIILSDYQKNISKETDITGMGPQKKDFIEVSTTFSSKELVCRTSKNRTKKLGVKLSNPDWQCKICSKQLSNQHSFKYHMQLHSDETPFLCSLCGEGFKTRNSYEGHLVIHDPNNPNTCLQCGKAYRQSSSLRTHMLTHTGEKPFRCGICGKGMTQKSGYKKHMLIHTGEKPHACDICGRDFRYSSNLIAHKRSHSGEKPYKGQRCEMKYHKNIHI